MGSIIKVMVSSVLVLLIFIAVASDGVKEFVFISPYPEAIVLVAVIAYILYKVFTNRDDKGVNWLANENHLSGSQIDDVVFYGGPKDFSEAQKVALHVRACAECRAKIEDRIDELEGGEDHEDSASGSDNMDNWLDPNKNRGL